MFLKNFIINKFKLNPLKIGAETKPKIGINKKPSYNRIDGSARN